MQELTHNRVGPGEPAGSDGWYRALVEHATDAIFTLEPEGTFRSVNPAFERITGWSSEACLGRSFVPWVHPDDLPRALELLDQAVRGRGTHAFELRILNRTGEYLHAEITSSVLREGDRVAGILGIGRDVSERKRAEEDTRRREAILEAVAFAAERFMDPDPWQRSLPEVLARLGDAAVADRVALYRNDTGPTGTGATQVLEWCAPGVPPSPDAGSSERTGYREAGLGRWLELFRSGQILVARADDVPPAEASLLDRASTASLAAVPVFSGTRLWGALGFSHHDGQRVWSTSELGALRAAAGILGAAIQRGSTQAALIESEDRYRRLVELSPDAIVVHRAGQVVFANPAAARLVGATDSGDVVGRSVLDFVHPDSRADVAARLEGLRRGLEAPLASERFVKLDGTPIDVEAVATPFSVGEETFVQVVIRDVTDRIRAQDALRRRTAYLSALHETSLALLDERDVDETLQAILTRAAALIGTDDAYLYLVDREADRIEVRLGLGVFADWVGSRLGRGEGLAGRVWLTGEPLVVEDYTTWPEARAPFGDPVKIHATVGVPLTSGKEVIGILGLTHCEEGRTFDRDEVEVLRQFAGLASIALGNARLYADAQARLAERTQAQERLRVAEAKFRALVEQIPAVTYTAEFGETAPWRYVSPQIETILGFTPAEWTVSPNLWSGRLHPEDRDRVMEAEEASERTGEPLVTEYRLFARDGHVVWVRDESVVVHDGEGTPLLQGVMFDVTERRHSEEQLRVAEERYRTLVEQIPAITYIDQIDRHPDGTATYRNLYASPQIAGMLGVSPEAFVGDGDLYVSLLHPDDRDRVLAADQHHYTTGERMSQEYRLIARDGRVVWVLDQAVAIPGPDGTTRFSQGMLYDVTDRKRAEEDLERALSIERDATLRLRSLDEMKNTFLHAVSHELRTPLAALMGMALTLERRDLALSEDERLELTRRLAANARKLDQLLTDLLDLDRLDRGIVEPRRRPTDVASLVRRVIENSDVLGTRRVLVDAHLVIAAVDGPKVERIVENLVANAARHTPPEATIWVKVRPERRGVLIAVEDDGPGIDPDLRTAIFEPFRQGSDPSGRAAGVGIGLSLVARFAELHGGRAWVQERPGGGASFRVSLPSGPS